MTTVERELVVHADDADGCVAHWGAVFVVVRRRRQTLESVELQRRAAEEQLRTPGTVGILYVYEPTAELPDRACRLATARIFEELRPRIACVAVVFEGEGIRYSMMRLVVRSLGTLFGQSFRRFIGSSVAEAAGWMATVLPSAGAQQVDPAELAAMVDRLRARQGSLSASGGRSGPDRGTS
jgi:hypothetical protein